MSSPKLKLAVGFASTGRRELLSRMILDLVCQTRQPDYVIICVARDDDLDEEISVRVPFKVEITDRVQGLTKQRNKILAAARDAEIIVFFDDDFLPACSYLANLERCFYQNEDVVAASGNVIADGVTGPGIELSDAYSLLRQSDAQPDRISNQYNAYGCNMAVRSATVRENEIWFDENLPLYGWLEDVDFCRRLACFGRVIKADELVGVHLGAKGGRTSGCRFGYSQIANPIYLWKKGSLHFDRALAQMIRNTSANFRGALRPEPWVDRRGRVQGNLRALRHLFTGELDPRRILEFD